MILQYNMLKLLVELPLYCDGLCDVKMCYEKKNTCSILNVYRLNNNNIYLEKQLRDMVFVPISLLKVYFFCQIINKYVAELSLCKDFIKIFALPGSTSHRLAEMMEHP